MNWFSRAAAVPALLFFATLHFAVSAHAVDTVTEPEKRLFLGIPQQCAFLQAENLLLMANGGGVYAFDAASGAQRWHRYLVSTRGYQGVTFGKRQVLGWSEQGVFLLDAATGRETWWRRNSQCGDVYAARLSPDESRAVVIGERGCLLYGVTDRTQRVLPAMPGFQGWLPGGQAMMFAQYDRGNENQVRKWRIMDADTGTVTPCWEEPYSWEIPAPSFSSLGQFAELTGDGDDGGTLKIRDARTGTVLREFKDTAGLSRYVSWMRDGKRLLCVTADRKELRVVDAETGAVQFALSRDGHRFALNTLFEDEAGAAWVFSKDGANHRYAWNLAPDGAPRKVLDGSLIAPAGFYFDRSEPGRLITMGMEEDRLWVYAVYALDGMRKLAEWRCRVPKQIYGGFSVNKALTHAAGSYPVNSDGYSNPQNMVFGLYVQDCEAPLRTGPGRVLAMSPDGKYLALQTDKQVACLYDAEADRLVAQYTATGAEQGQRSMNAVFSDDGKRVALNTRDAIEVTELSGDFPRRSMAMDEQKRLWGGGLCFSPNGERLLFGEYNTAWLFDTASGALLHRFEETERFADLYSYRGGFWSGLAETAKDWAGLVTDRFKAGSYLSATFAEGGSRVITHTAGQILRVWDAESGRMLHAIHTRLPEKRNRDGRISNQIALSANRRFAFVCNGDNYAPAALYSVADGTLLRQYRLPESSWPTGTPADDGRTVYVSGGMSLCQWPGAPQDLLDQLSDMGQ
jgi:WD40 repeat protein